jgi:pyridoxamine 5'-phosphate oxidase
MAKNNLAETDFLPDPIDQFDLWYRDRLTLKISYPDSMTLATASADGWVSARTVLLKSYGKQGFYFFSNYRSRKGRQLEENPNAALLFYWPETVKQVRIEGIVARTSEEESDEYFSSRPPESRLAAWASDQSSEIPDRKHLEERFIEAEKSFRNKSIDRPPWWGGYRLIPSWFEFWQEGKHRLHDRICYIPDEGGWKKIRLAP